MQQEIKALKENNTWKIVQLPEKKHSIGCKWVFKIKYKDDGQIDRFKARLVAKGHSQTKGVDYKKIFAPMVKMVTIRFIIAWIQLIIEPSTKWIFSVHFHKDIYLKRYIWSYHKTLPVQKSTKFLSLSSLCMDLHKLPENEMPSWLVLLVIQVMSKVIWIILCLPRKAERGCLLC